MSSATRDQRIGDAPIQADLLDMMSTLARVVDQALNGDARGAGRKNGFVLLVFPFEGRDGRANYISNADRAEVVTLLKEQLARFEGQPEVTGRA